MSQLRDGLALNSKDTSLIKMVSLATWLFALFGLWMNGERFKIATPMQTLIALDYMLRHMGFLYHLWASFLLTLEASLIALAISLTLTYSMAFPPMRPFVAGVITKIRYLPFTGLTFYFIAWTRDGHMQKIAMETFAVTAFLLYSCVKVMQAIPNAQYEYARTVKLRPLKVTWYVVVRGTRAEMMIQFFMNQAIAWMMLTSVEYFSASEGGLGTLLKKMDRSNILDKVLAILLVQTLVAVCWDAIGNWLTRVLNRHWVARTERSAQ